MMMASRHFLRRLYSTIGDGFGGKVGAVEGSGERLSNSKFTPLSYDALRRQRMDGNGDGDAVGVRRAYQNHNQQHQQQRRPHRYGDPVPAFELLQQKWQGAEFDQLEMVGRYSQQLIEKHSDDRPRNKSPPTKISQMARTAKLDEEEVLSRMDAKRFHDPSQMRPPARMTSAPKRMLVHGYSSGRLFSAEFPNSLSLEELGHRMAEAMGDRNPEMITKMVVQIGREQALSLFREVQQVEAGGGMLVDSGVRRRTPGGVFIYKAIFEKKLVPMPTKYTHLK